MRPPRTGQTPLSPLPQAPRNRRKSTVLGLVSSRVPGRDRRTRTAYEQFFEESIAGAPSGPLEVVAGKRHVLPAHKAPAAETGRKLPHEGLVGVRVRAAQAMVQMHGCDHPSGKQGVECVQQRDRVRAAGDGRADGPLPREHSLPGDTLAQLGQHTVTVDGFPPCGRDADARPGLSSQKR